MKLLNGSKILLCIVVILISLPFIFANSNSQTVYAQAGPCTDYQSLGGYDITLDGVTTSLERTNPGFADFKNGLQAFCQECRNTGTSNDDCYNIYEGDFAQCLIIDKRSNINSTTIGYCSSAGIAVLNLTRDCIATRQQSPYSDNLTAAQRLCDSVKYELTNNCLATGTLAADVTRCINQFEAVYDPSNTKGRPVSPSCPWSCGGTCATQAEIFRFNSDYCNGQQAWLADKGCPATATQRMSTTTACPGSPTTCLKKNTWAPTCTTAGGAGTCMDPAEIARYNALYVDGFAQFNYEAGCAATGSPTFADGQVVNPRTGIDTAKHQMYTASRDLCVTSFCATINRSTGPYGEETTFQSFDFGAVGSDQWCGCCTLNCGGLKSNNVGGTPSCDSQGFTAQCGALTYQQVQNIANLNTSSAQCEGADRVACENCIRLGSSWTGIGCINTSSTSGIVASIMRIVLGTMGGIFLLLMISAGYLYNTNKSENIELAKKRITAMLGALIFIVFSVLLLRIIGVNILDVTTLGVLG